MTIAVTMGDPSGVGPEIILKAYANKEIEGLFVVIGDLSVLEFCQERLDLHVEFKIVESTDEAREGCFNLIDMGLMAGVPVVIGDVTAESGYAAYHYVENAAKLALTGKIDAIVTLPVNKEAVRLTYPGFTGHTELLAEMCGEEDYTM